MASVSVCLTTMTSCSTHSNIINIDQSYVKLWPLKYRKQVLESLDVLHYSACDQVQKTKELTFQSFKYKKFDSLIDLTNRISRSKV